MKDSRTQVIRVVSLVAILGNAFLAILKIGGGIFSHSLAVVGDGLDSSVDVVISLITFYVATLVSLPADKKHPFGHSRAEALATLMLSSIVFFAGLQLTYSSIGRFFIERDQTMPDKVSLIIIVISIVGKFILSLIMLRKGKNHNSSMLIANGKNMQADIFLSIGVLLGLVFTNVLNMPILDSVTAFLVGFWVMKTAIAIFMDVKNEIMDGCCDGRIYERIFEAVARVEGAHNPHRARVRRLSYQYMIELDIEVDPDITVRESHEICNMVEKEIKLEIENIYDIVVHIEPLGNLDNEQYGISKNEV